MALLGENVLPESVNSRRRQLRNRLMDLRDPIRSRRLRMVPGPDVVGKVENTLTDVRDRVVSREGVLSGMKSRVSSGNSGKSDTSRRSSTKQERQMV